MDAPTLVVLTLLAMALTSTALWMHVLHVRHRPRGEVKGAYGAKRRGS
ncbi:MAG: hypothetical protein QXT74_03015 [Candidatus Nezhaarchaeales archaeon]